MKKRQDVLQKIHVNLPEEIHQKLRIKCAIDNITIQKFVSNLIHESVSAVVASDNRNGRRR